MSYYCNVFLSKYRNTLCQNVLCDKGLILYYTILGTVKPVYINHPQDPKLSCLSRQVVVVDRKSLFGDGRFYV